MLNIQKTNTPLYNKTKKEPSFKATVPEMYAGYMKAKSNGVIEPLQVQLIGEITRFFGKLERKMAAEDSHFYYKLGEKNLIPESLAQIDIDGTNLKVMDEFLHSDKTDNLGYCVREILQKMQVNKPEVILIRNGFSQGKLN